MGLRISPFINFSNDILMERLSNVFCVRGKEVEPFFEVMRKALLWSFVNLLYCPEGKIHVLMAARIITSIISVVAVGRLNFFLIGCLCDWIWLMLLYYFVFSELFFITMIFVTARYINVFLLAVISFSCDELAK